MEMKWHPRGGRRNICNCLLDWSNVPVDTLVRVRDYKSDEWTLRATSVTAEGDTERWKHCELVEVEDE